MANNFMQHQFSMTNNQMGQLESISNNLGLAIQMGSVSGVPVSQHISMSTVQMASYDPGSQRLPVPNQQVAHIGSNQYVMTNMQLEEMEAMLHNAGLQHLSAQNKRKAPMESATYICAPQQLSMPNKRMTQMQNRPWLQQMSTPNEKVGHMQFMPKTSGSLRLPVLNKKVIQLESVPSKSGPQQSLTPKNQTSQMQSAKAQSVTFESVRSKMRESLAAALALASQQQEKPTEADKNSQSETANSPKMKVENSQPSEPVSAAAFRIDHGSANKEIVSCNETSSQRKHFDGRGVSQGILVRADGNPAKLSSSREFQPSVVSIGEDTLFGDAFIGKDEFLQGNRLAWVLETDRVLSEEKEIAVPEKEKSDQVELGGVVEEQSVQSPQDLAFKVEFELYKLYGGVNKKYKEKGRSLLFNLKDRNNPELRERVMSGDITPERLCSMTAEELASKELSEWRIAKAEELAQMVVLQDTDVDVRHLVRKTHKGEFQVEVEQDDGISVEVSVGTSLLTRSQSQTKKTEAHSQTEPMVTEDHVKAASEKINVQDDINEGTFTIPSMEGSDLMQGLMVDDEVKDKDLPPIVSLDEFMQSLDSEPPFEILKDESGKSTLTTDKDSSKVALASESPIEFEGTKGRTDTASNEPVLEGAELKSSDSNVKSKIISVSMPKAENVWEGLLQLNISSRATAVGCFKSGEKASAKDWASFLEIKGRVRLNAFEKFLQDLRMSRSRAIMVVHFGPKDGCSESEIVSIRELADSYVSDDRVGFAEPAPGVELYFCPPHPQTLQMLNKHLPKAYTETLHGVDDGLVGVVVWRKAPLTSAMSRKKQRHSSVKPNPIAKTPPSDDGDDDDVPPGFGPGAPRDLPEFNFSTHNPSRYNPLARPVELIHKYGKPKDSARIRKWNEDDDDIPEWQPQFHQQKPMLPLSSSVAYSLPHAQSQPQQGSRWASQSGLASNGQFYAVAPPRQDLPRRRDF